MHGTGAPITKAASTVPIFSLDFRHLPLLFLIHYLQRSKSTQFSHLALDKVKTRLGDKNIAAKKKYRMGKYLVSLSLVIS